jgi:4-amino-4-deoxy-L-arabinose transferase-like glycosyltransferase
MHRDNEGNALRKLVLFVIGFWVIFYLINNYVWLKNSASFPIEPQNAKFYAYMATWTELIRDLDFKMMNLLLVGAGVYPPLFFLPAVFSSLLFNGNYLFHIMLNIIYFALLLVFVYLLAKELYNERCAIISVCLLSLYPAVYGFSRKFFIEFEMMWMVVFTILILVKSSFFNVRKYSVFLGIFMGLGLMTKGSFPLFVIGPFVYTVLKWLKAQGIPIGRKGRLWPSPFLTYS